MKRASSPPLLMVEFFSRGGLYHYALQLGLALAAQGWPVVFLTARHPEILPPLTPRFSFLPRLCTWNPRRDLARPSLARRFWHATRYLAMWCQVVVFACRLRPSVVLLGDFEHRCDAWFCALLRLAGFPLADVCHNVVAFDRRSAHRLLRQPRWRDRLLARLDRVFVHGESLAATLYQRTGRAPVVVPHGAGDLCAEAAGPDPLLRSRLDLPAAAPVALLFGTLTKYKGIPWLLDAMAALSPTARPHLVIAGFPAADAQLAAWQGQAQRLGLAACLRWVPEYVPWPEVAWYFRLASFVVLPYYQASQSGAAHLALSFGKPVIASLAGALPEAVVPDRNGLLVPVGDTGALARALARLTADPEYCRLLGRQAAEMAVRAHGWGAIARRIARELEKGSQKGDGLKCAIFR